jgi:hypothetical protein
MIRARRHLADVAQQQPHAEAGYVVEHGQRVRAIPRNRQRPGSGHVTLVPDAELEQLRRGIDPQAAEGR